MAVYTRKRLKNFSSRYKIIVVAIIISFAWVQPLSAHTFVPIYPLVFPVLGESKYTDTFGAPRSGGRTHQGADIFGYKGQPLLAVRPGTITKMGYGSLSGFMIFMRDDEENTYYYIHLNNDNPGTDDGKGGEKTAFAEGLEVGDTVKAGQIIGYLGDSGNAEYTSPHLHFELHPSGQSAVCPNKSLDQARRESTALDSFIYPKITLLDKTNRIVSPDRNGYNDTTKFNFSLARDGFVTLKILNYRGEVHRVVSSQLFYNTKKNLIAWNGRDKSGKPLPNGNYVYELLATNGFYNSKFGIVSVQAGRMPPGNDVPSISNFKAIEKIFYPGSSNPSINKTNIQYTLSTDSIVTLTLHNHKGVVKNIVPTRYRKAGDRSVIYNGLDSSGALLPAGNYRLEISATNNKGTTSNSMILGIR